MKSFMRRVIDIPEKLTAWAAAGILAAMIWVVEWLSSLIGFEFPELPLQAVSVAIAVVATAILKAVFEAFIPEKWHNAANTLLEWIANFLVAGFAYKMLLA